MKYVKKRGRKYHYVRRIPTEIKHLDERQLIQVSLKTDSLDVANQRALLLDQHVQAYWQSLAKTDSSLDKQRQQAILLAQINGMQYRTVAEVANQELGEILKRTSLAAETHSAIMTEAVLGGVEKSEFTLSQALDKYWALSKDKVLGKSENQIRKWRNPRIKAINNAISVVGNKQIEHLNRDDVLNFKDWWLDRMTQENIGASSANKDFIHLRGVLQHVSDNLRLDLPVQKLFERITIRQNSRSTRLSFTPEFVQNTLLNKNKLKGIEFELWLFICAMADSGARISELTGLDATAGEISLHGDIPFINIRPNKTRELKTPQSERVIPLVGSSLFAFQLMPNGFTNYATRPDGISNDIGKWFRDNNLLPTSKHTLYSLRHCFQDRLTAVEAPDKIQAELMGHKFYRPKYGAGSSLEQKHKWLNQMAFKIDN